MPQGSRIKLAVCQYAPRVGDMEANLGLGLNALEGAAAAGAELVVLPELASSGYAFASPEEALRCSQDAATGTTLRAWQQVCRERRVHAVAGFAELEGGQLFNSAAVLGPEGLVGVYRKSHLFYNEKSFFRPGQEFPVFDLPFGRLGVLICYDTWFPEAARLLTLAGAEIICVPTNWVGNFRDHCYDDRGWTMGNYACVGIATQNQVYVAAADRIGVERDLKFLGCSCVVAPDGWMLAGPAASDTEATVLVDVDLARATALRRRTPRNHTLGDRRPELYAELAATPATVG